MFVSLNQFYFFMQSVFIGVLTAFLYEPISLFKTFVKNKIIGCAVDVAFCVVPFLIYLDLSLKFSFPCFRAYMFLGVVLGFFIERKSFNKMLAKVYFVVYNKTISFIRRKNRDGRKETKIGSGSYGNVGYSAIRFNRSSRISANRHRCKEKAKRSAYCRKN